jgi:iron complex transport system ATP-binding protein
VLEANNITYRVKDRELISQVTVSFPPGKLHLIVGPNGAGKSTLIKVLSRLLHPQTGTVTYAGIDTKDVAEIDIAKHRAVLSQAVEVAFALTVREVVMMGRYPHFGGRPGPVDEEVVDKMMAYFDVTEFAARDYQTLSGGERQRVNFARVLAQVWRMDNHDGSNLQCRYLFLDEPLTFLDIRHQIDFMKKVREFGSAADVITVGVVHDLNLAARFADQIVLMDQGRIVATGKPPELLTVERIRVVFGVEARFISAGENDLQIAFD